MSCEGYVKTPAAEASDDGERGPGAERFVVALPSVADDEGGDEPELEAHEGSMLVDKEVREDFQSGRDS